MTNRRRQQLRRLWRSTLAFLIEDDMKDGERLMNELWLECGTEEERALVKDEIVALANGLRQEALESQFIINPEGEVDDSLPREGDAMADP